jgi:HEAT repeat protein
MDNQPSVDVDALIIQLIDADETTQIRAIWELGQRKEHAIPALARALQATNMVLRQNAAVALGRTGLPAAADLLHDPARTDPDTTVRAHAVHALGRIGDSRAGVVLRAALNDSAADVRAVAAEALGKIIDTDAIEPLIQCLSDRDAHVRLSAARALEPFHDPRSVPPLLALLRDPDASVREGAVMTLGELRNAQTLDALIAALDDPEPDVRQAVMVALQSLGDHRALPALEHHAARDTSVTSWGLPLKDSAAQTIKRILSHP